MPPKRRNRNRRRKRKQQRIIPLNSSRSYYQKWGEAIDGTKVNPHEPS